MEYLNSKKSQTDRSAYAGRIANGNRGRNRRFSGARRRGFAALSLLLVTLCLSAGAARAETGEGDVRVVNMVAERFFFVPSRIKVEQGTTVEFRIRSADTNHGFRIRKAGINVVIPKRGKGEARVIFRAKEKGRYDFECSKPCGAGHNMMRGTIIVE